MNIRKTIVTAAVALTTVAMIAPAAAGAVTTEELQAQISALLAQISALQSQLSSAPSSPSTVPAACVGVTFSRNLAVGSTGSDVKCMQAIMNALGYKVALSGAGSMGNETTTFGPLTLVAVQKFQVAKFGYSASQVGPLTRAELNAWLGGSSTPTTPTTPTTPVPTGAGLTVQLASDNPATGTVVDASALHPMLKLVFLNGDNASVNVTGLKLKRTGVSADASVTNTYLFNGVNRLTDGAAVSETIISFNNSTGLFTVPAGGSVVISVLSDIDGTASETVGMQVVSASSVTTNASSVKGSYPLSGNLQTIATGTLAGVNFNTTTTPAAASIDPQDGYTVWQNSTTITTRAVDLKRMTFRITGSAKDTDLKNFKLYIDGVQVGTAQNLSVNSLAERTVTFDLSSSPKRLETGTRIIKVLADVIGGSSLNFTTNLWSVSDATFVDTQYAANVLAQANSTTFSKRASGQQSINSGTLTVTKKSDSPSGDIVDGANGVTLAKFELKAAGEKVKVETLYVSAVVSTSTVASLRNGALFANGVQIGSTSTLHDNGSATAQTTFNLGSSLIVEPGSPVTLEVRADIFDNDGTNNVTSGTTIQVRLEGGSSNNNATGLVSAATIDVPSGDVDANALTVAQGSLTLSKYTAYTNHAVVAPLTDYKVAHYTLTAATSEAVNLTAINVAVDEVSDYATNLYVKYGTQTTTTKATVAASNSWSINYTLPAGTTIDVMVYMDVSSSMSSGTGTVTVDIDGTTGSSAVTADSSAVSGQDLTYTSGTFATAFDSTPQNQVVSGNQTVLAGRFKLTSSYQNYTATELRFTTGSSLPISSATLKDSATGATIKTVAYDNTNSYFNFTGLNIAIPASTSKRVDLYWNLAVPSSDASSTNVNAVAALTYVKYSNPQGTVTTDTNTRTGNETYVFRAVPTLEQVVLPTTAIINGGTKDLYKFKVTAPSQGPVNVKQFKLAVNWSDGGGNNDTLEVESLKLLKDGVDITSSVTIVEEDTGATATSTNGISESTSQVIVTWAGSTEDSIPAGTSTTYLLTGVPQGFNTTATVSTASATDSVSFGFTRDSAHQTAGYNYINVGTTLTGILKLYSSASANASAQNANLIWSDESAVAHSASTTAGTGDWSNSYLFNVIGTQNHTN